MSFFLAEEELRDVGTRVDQIIDGLNFKMEFLRGHISAINAALEAYPKDEIDKTNKAIADCQAELDRYNSLQTQQLSPKQYQGRLGHIPVYYSDYLCLDEILNAQKLQSAKYGHPEHHEMLFIIIHQAFELWFKQILYELEAVIKRMEGDYLPEKDMSIVLHHFERVIEIQKLLIKQFDVLETLSPLDFMDFRDYLFPASGFQSWQFRLLENLLGLQSAKRVQYERKAYHTKLSPEHQEIVKTSEAGINLFEVVQKWLERTPFLQEEDSKFNFLTHYVNAVDNMYEEDKNVVMSVNNSIGDELQKEIDRIEENRKGFLSLFDEEKHNEQIAQGSRRLSYRATQAALLINVYQEEPILHIPFKILQSLTLIDELFTQWRSRHMLMVHRMIGSKLGTGGSSGYWYLRATVEKGRVFTDIGNMSTYLMPRNKVPELPHSIKSKLAYAFADK